MQTLGYAVDGPDGKFHPWEFQRKPLGDTDIQIDILYCGICHSDLHQVKNEWKNSQYPMIPGHEIVGKVVKVGSKVQKFKEGDIAGIGCLIDSCRECSYCKEGEENFCLKGAAGTYNSTYMDKKTPTYGGYSTVYVVDESFALKISPKFTKLEAVAPLLCAGITTFSPINHWKVSKGQKVGVWGLGGLGHMAVKYAVSLGADVTVFSTSQKKEEDAKRLGAQHFALSTDPATLKAQNGTFDFIIDTVSAEHPVEPEVHLLKPHGVLCLVGAPPTPFQLHGMSLIFGNKTITGSLIGGIPETQKMLDYSAEHGITADIELIKIDQVEEAYERMLKGDVKYRFVIDIASLKNLKP